MTGFVKAITSWQLVICSTTDQLHVQIPSQRVYDVHHKTSVESAEQLPDNIPQR